MYTQPCLQFDNFETKCFSPNENSTYTPDDSNSFQEVKENRYRKRVYGLSRILITLLLYIMKTSCTSNDSHALLSFIVTIVYCSLLLLLCNVNLSAMSLVLFFIHLDDLITLHNEDLTSNDSQILYCLLLLLFIVYYYYY